jgi:hypothetical protein
VHGHFKNAFSEKGRLRTTCPKLYEFIRENPDKDRYSVLILGQFDRQEANTKERQYIIDYDTRTNGCNVAPGGNNPEGAEHYLYGKSVSKHIVAASVAARIGKPLSEEHRAKQRKSAAEGRSKRTDLKPVVCDQTGETWDSVSSCAKHFGVNPVAVIYRIRNQIRSKARSGNAMGNYTFSYSGQATPTKKIHKAPKDSFEIRCNETGQVFKNMREACSVLELSPAQLCNYFKLGPTTKKYTVRQVKGYTFTKI